MSRARLPLNILLVALALPACTPATAIRRTAMVPAATTPSRIGRPLEAHEVRIAGQINPIRPNAQSLWIEAANENDPGLLIPDVQVGGMAYVGVTNFFEIGGQVHYAPRQWGRRNVRGVLGMDQEDAFMLMGGPGIRTTLHIEDMPLSVSLSSELNFARVTQAIYVCRFDPCVQPLGMADAELYALDRVETDAFLLPNVGLHFGSDLGEIFHVSAFMSIEPGIKNNGFDPDINNLDNSTLSTYPIYITGVGFEARLYPVFVNATFTLPLEFEEAIHFGPGLVVQTGASF